jgi:hypothetical protein
MRRERRSEVIKTRPNEGVALERSGEQLLFGPFFQPLTTPLSGSGVTVAQGHVWSGIPPDLSMRPGEQCTTLLSERQTLLVQGHVNVDLRAATRAAGPAAV